MARVERGNVVLDIKDTEVQRYLDLGYNVVDEKGKVIKACVPTDLATLRKAYIEHTAKIAELEATIKSLQTKPAKATSKKNVE